MAQINAGMLLMGIIKEVREADALISLPNNLTGFVEVDEVRESLPVYAFSLDACSYACTHSHTCMHTINA